MVAPMLTAEWYSLSPMAMACWVGKMPSFCSTRFPDQKDAALEAAGGAACTPRLIRISGRQTKDPQHHCALLTQLTEK